MRKNAELSETGETSQAPQVFYKRGRTLGTAAPCSHGSQDENRVGLGPPPPPPPTTLSSFSRNTLGVSSIHSLQNLPREYPGPQGCQTGCPPGSRQPTGLAALCGVGDLGAHRTWWQDHAASGRSPRNRYLRFTQRVTQRVSMCVLGSASRTRSGTTEQTATRLCSNSTAPLGQRNVQPGAAPGGVC